MGATYMGRSVQSIDIYKLEPGMVLAREILNKGIVLVNKDVVITSTIISSLANYLIFEPALVYIENEPEEIADKKTKKVIDNSVAEIEESFNGFANVVEYMFNNLFCEDITYIEEIEKFSKKIQSELKATGAIIKNIVLYGSGEDCIYRHSVNVAALSSILGKWIGLDTNEIELLTYSAMLHDIGKAKIDEKILNKVEPLSQNEFSTIKNHSVIGYNLVKQIPNLHESVLYGVLMHHERLDKSGYPLGVEENKIHNFAKIIAIADTFDAVNSNRVYKKKRGPFQALEIIQKESLGKLDYEYCKIFLDHIINYYIGEEVILNTNKVCKILQINLNDLSRPLLLDGAEFLDLSKHKELNVENLVV